MTAPRTQKNVPFELEQNLRCICEFDLRGRQCAAYLLQNKRGYRLMFGFNTKGFHSFLGGEQIQSTLKNQAEGLKGILPDEILRIHTRSTRDDQERLEELESCANSHSFAPLLLLNYAQQRLTRNLSARGIRRPTQINLFASYTLDGGKASGQDMIERILGGIFEKYEAIKGRGKSRAKQALSKMLLQAFEEGFMYWEEQLNTRMGLAVTPMLGPQLLRYAWRQFNWTEPPVNPHVVTLKEINGVLEVTEEINSSLSPASVFIRGEKGLPSTPKGDERWVHVKQEFVGALVQDDKLKGLTLEQQLNFWSQPFSQLENCEVVTELSLGNTITTRVNLQRMVRQQKTAIKTASDRNDVDVVASLTGDDSEIALRKLAKGCVPINTSTAFFLYRDRAQNLNQACQRVVNMLPYGTLIRETDIAWQIWRNKLPIVYRPLLSDSRRQTYFNDELPLPLVRTRQLDNRGLELLSRQSGEPICINFVTQHRGIAIFAKSRRGKSVLAADLIRTALDYGLPVIVLDYGDVKGTTTFTDLANYLGEAGANIDAGHTANNLLELPDLRNFGPKEQADHLATYRSFLVTALETLVMGSERGTQMAKRVHSLLTYVVASFYDDPDIDARYKAAFEDGFGTPAWMAMPTLVDLIAYLRSMDMNEIGGQMVVGEALGETLMQLSTWLKSPVGKSISQPSAVRQNAQLISFSLRGAKDEAEATVCALGAQSFALRRALEHPKSFIVVDEGSVLFRQPGLVYVTAEMVCNGAKSGISVCLISQDVDTVANSVAGPQILQNLDVKLIGAIEEDAVKNISHHLELPPGTLTANTQEYFLPNVALLCSYWLIICEGRKTQVAHFPTEELISLVANNPDEKGARQRFMARYENSLRALPEFAQVYAAAKRSGKSMNEIAQGVSNEAIGLSSVPVEQNGHQSDVVQVESLVS